jgi:hypothetical protein
VSDSFTQIKTIVGGNMQSVWFILPWHTISKTRSLVPFDLSIEAQQAGLIAKLGMAMERVWKSGMPIWNWLGFSNLMTLE